MYMRRERPTRVCGRGREGRAVVHSGRWGGQPVLIPVVSGYGVVLRRERQHAGGARRVAALLAADTLAVAALALAAGWQRALARAAELGTCLVSDTLNDKFLQAVWYPAPR